MLTADSPDLLKAIVALPKEIRAELEPLFTELFQAQYTGPVTLHFHLGRPRTAQLLPPQIRFSD